MTILNIATKNVRELQSRTAHRGQYLAHLEAARKGLKQRLKDFRASGLASLLSEDFNIIRDQFDGVRDQIYELAHDQRLDRQLLKTQYHIQSLHRPNFKTEN